MQLEIVDKGYFMIKQLSTHSFSYRNFLIVMLPAKAMNPITRYHVQYNDGSYGLFDSMNDAVKYIDRLRG